MNSKTHNLTLQGVTGVIFGIISIIYAWIIQTLLTDFSSGIGVGMLPISFLEIILTAISVFYILFSYALIYLINKRRRKKLGLRGWEETSKKIRLIYVILLVFCGIFTYFLVSKGNLKLITPTMLLLFGIGSIISNILTKKASLILGALFIINGVLAIIFPSKIFLLWKVAFGGYLIIYGLLFLYKK